MIPAWLSIELALIPVVMAAMSGLVWLVRLEGAVKALKERATRQVQHNDLLYAELRSINKNLHLIMGKLQIPPVE